MRKRRIRNDWNCQNQSAWCRIRGIASIRCFPVSHHSGWYGFCHYGCNEGHRKAASHEQNKTHLISDPLNMADVHSSKIVVAEDVVEVVVKLLEYEASMSIVHKWVPWRTFSSSEKRIYLTTAQCSVCLSRHSSGGLHKDGFRSSTGITIQGQQYLLKKEVSASDDLDGYLLLVHVIKR